MPRGRRSAAATAAAAKAKVDASADAMMAADASISSGAVDDDQPTTSKTKTAQSLTQLLSTLSKPEDLLTSILLPSGGTAANGNNGENTGEELTKLLRATSRNLFSRLEELATLEEKLKRKADAGHEDDNEEAADDDDQGTNDAPLSGLTELYTGDEGEDGDDGSNDGDTFNEGGLAADAETVWGQVDLQNETLLPKLRKSVKSLSKKISKEGASTVRLLDLGDLSDEDDDGSGEEGMAGGASTSGNESEDGGNDDDDSAADSDDEDDEARRIRERMERAMADMSDDDDMDDDMAGDAGMQSKSKSNRDKGIEKDSDDDDEEDLEDPAADELNDGFFDINEMEAFADEEEDYLPDDIAAAEEEERRKKNKKAKLPHQRLRQGEESSDSEDESDEEPTVAKRKKYRDNDEIDALYELYQEAEDGDGDGDEEEDEEKDVVNMTAADFFGQPNRRYLRAKKGQDVGSKSKDASKAKPKKQTIDEEVDSWDEHSFGDEDDDGPGWRDDNSDVDEKIINDGRDARESSDDDEDASDNKPMEEEDDGDGSEEETELKSSHAVSSGKLLQQTEQLEREALAEKPWQMMGESKGAERPTNSLLEATPEFEVANKMAPIITVEHTASIEEMIKKRIIDEDWDDVVPRELPDIGLGKRKGELPEVSQEKSKLGLGELYEREYLKKVAGYDKDAVERETEEDKVKNEMKALFANLCSKLDALSNYHFAPRPVADEAEVRTVTTPAIAMEEALPLHVSDARGVAPEEIYAAKKGRESVIRGENEMDQSERKRLRNAKKSARRKARKAKLADEKLISRLQPGLGLNNPYEKRKLREELQMARASGKVTAGEIDANKDYTTSTKFFQRMQENVEMEVRGGGANEGRKRKRKDQGEGRKSSAYKL